MVLTRIAVVVLVLALLSSTGLAQAEISPLWPELGGSGSGTGVSQTSDPKAVFDGSVAVGSDGRPVVTYTEYPDAVASQGAIIVKQWTGSAWQILGGAGGIGQGYEPQVQIASTGAIYVAWLSDDVSGDTEIRLRVWNGASFDELGGSDSPGGISGTNAGITVPFSLALTPAGDPVVAFLGFAETGHLDVIATPVIVDSTVQVYVRRWTGLAWEFVGSGFTGGGASNARSFSSPIGAILHDADSPSLAVDSTGQPVVAFTYFTTINGVPAANTDIYVTRWNGTAWTAVGPAVPAADGAPGRGGAGGVSSSTSGSFNPALATGASGKLALAWEEEPATGGVYVWVRTWNGSAWVQLASSATGSGFTLPDTTNVLPRVALDPSGRPIVTWQALIAIQDPAQIFVRRWNGSTAWEELGFHSARDAGISDATFDALAPSLALTPAGGTAPAGVPTIAWLDVQSTGSGQVFLRQFFTGATVSLTTRVTGTGTVSSEPIGVECSGGTCVAPFPSGTDVVLIAQPAPGWTFTGWADGCSGNTSCMLSMTTARSVNASFVAVHALSVAVATPAGTSGQGTIGTITGAGLSCAGGAAGTCGGDVLHGTAVDLLATPQPGNRFLSWSGGPCNGRTTASCSFTMNANSSTTALFRAVTGVRVLKAGNGAGTVSGAGISCGTDCFEEVFTGTSVTLTPAPATGSSFLGWSGDACSGLTGACVVATSSLNRTVTATFQLKKQALAVSLTGAGVAASSPAGIDCGNGHTPCATVYDYGTTVSLTPVADVDNMLASWTGCTSLNGSVCNVVMTANRTVTGKFVAAHTLSVAASGNGGGRITATTPPGITCIGNCSVSQLFPATASVALTPQPAVGTSFRWLGTGDICTGAGACTTLMGANHSAVGQFTLNRHTLGVTNRLSGNVKDVPGGTLFDCGNGAGICSGTFDYGTPITLRATANDGFTFVNWTGTACAGSTNPTCPITLKANVSVTPNFRARTFLTVSKTGNGAGTVSGPGISCGADCSEAEFDGKPVTLTAAPAVGSRFTGFSGACVSPTSPCTFPPAGDNQSVTATFELIPYTVTVASRANGGVADNALLGLPDPVNCGAGGSDCQTTLNYSTLVELKATAITGSRFVNWTGDVCAGSTNTSCRFTIPARNVSVAPNFKDVTTLTLTKGGQGTVASTPAGISCGPACTTASFDFARGIAVKLTPTPVVGWNFDGFSGACSGLTCSVNASAPTALVGANFSIQHRRLAVTVVGQGSVGGGAACDAGSTPCALDFDYGTNLLLTATANPGHRFTGWSQNCAGTGNCSALMTINRSVTATFKPEFSLTVTKPGNSPTQGTITASPAGITCGADCSQVYLGGTVVTLTRGAPVTGTTFRWGGACAFAGTNPTCALPMNASVSVSADYSLQRLGLTVAKVGAALGTVTGLAGAVNCGSDCDEVVNYGTPVMLVAQAGSSPAAEFVSWAGCTTPASSSNCSLTMTANKTVTATFRPLVASVAVEALSTSTLAMGGVRQLSAIATFTDGSRQDVTAHLETLWTSSAPTVATVSKTGLVTGKAIGNTSVTAIFKSFGDARLVNVDALLAIPTPIIVSCSPYGDASLDPTHLACLPSGLSFSVHCEAAGMYASGSQDITDQVTWVTSNAAVAQSTGLVAFNSPVRQSFRIAGNGTAIVRATLGGKTSSTTGTLGQQAWVVQGAAATVTDIQVTPAGDTITVGGARQLVANATLTQTGVCPSTSQRDFSRIVGWSSSAETVADVSFFGGVTGIAQGGPVTITATYPRAAPLSALSDSASITVGP